MNQDTYFCLPAGFRRRLAAALERMDNFVFLETLRPSGQEYRSLLFTDPAIWLECGPDDDALDFLALLDRETGRDHRWAGWFGYEFGYLLEPSLRKLLTRKSPAAPLARVGIFTEPAVFDHRTGQFQGEWPQTTTQAGEMTVGQVRPGISREVFLEALATIKKYILAGDTYQINFTFPLSFTITGSLARLYFMLCASQSVSYAAWIRCRGVNIMSFSPELFFRIDNTTGRIVTRPMKGTLKRGRDCDEDRLLADWLRNDGKSRSENVMIVDLLRNDLGRLLHLLGGGRVEVESLFDIETYESLLQMTSTVSGQADGGSMPLAVAMPALFPCGSVTGAPKIRAMQIIAELEQGPRGVYCGAIGYGGSEGVCLNVPIRTLTIAGNQGVMPVGAGIVHDSDPEAEWEECLLKARFLTSPRPDFELIETLLWQPGKGYNLFAEHLARLESSARYFGYPLDRETVVQKLEEVVREAGDVCMRVRLLLAGDGRSVVSAVPLSCASGGEAEQQLFLVALAKERMAPDNIFLHHKTTHRSWYDRGREEAVRRGLFDLLYVNTSDEVTEGTICNVFYTVRGQLYTPPVACGLLPGTLRASLIGSGRVLERVLCLNELENVEALYMGNSVRGLVPVRLIVDKNGMKRP